MTNNTGHPTSAMAVANWFINRCMHGETNVPPCDQMKLYKLVFYSHAWYLGNTKNELFGEDVEAWPHGPVVRDLYSEFSGYGRSVIQKFGKQLVVTDSGKFEFEKPVYHGELEKFFERVWNKYKDLTGIQLSNGTHDKGEPWSIVAEMYNNDLSLKPSIPSDVISKVFEQKIKASPQ